MKIEKKQQQQHATNIDSSVTTENFISRYVDFLDRHAKKLLCFFVVATVWAFWLSTKMQVNSAPDDYFVDGVPIKEANKFINKHMDGVLGPEIVIDTHQTDGVKDPAFLQKVEQYQNWLLSLPYVHKTMSMVDIIKQMNRALNGGDQNFYILPTSQETIAQLLFLYSMGLPAGKELGTSITVDYSSMRLNALWSLTDARSSLAAIAKIEAKARQLGLSAYVTGKTPLLQRMNHYVVNTFTSSNILAPTLMFFLMLFIFRSFSLGILSMIPNVIPLFFGLALIVLMGKSVHIGLALVTSVCLGIAVDDTIHFLGHLSISKSKNMSVRDSIIQVFQEVGVAIVVTTIILAVGLGSFALGSFTPNRDFGILCATILVIALMQDLVLLPVMLLLMGRRKERTIVAPVTAISPL